jgi:pimeloyl-ACP methyl ester carboxylesterase
LVGSAAGSARAQDDGGAVGFGPGDFAGLVGIGDGRRMYLECHGQGRPTVVLDAGLRSRSDFWIERTDETRGRTVVPAVASFTRVCIYDRPGTTLGTTEFSRSDPVPMPRTARDAVADLHALLRAARVPGPYVLGGHSTGGLISRLYAAAHPKQVVGMVLVDALSEFLRKRLTREQTAVYDELNNGPLPGLEGYPDLEQILFRPSFEQMARAAAANPLPEIPLVVISRGQPFPLPEGLPAGLTTEVSERAWTYAQNRLARLLPDARHLIARRSQHYIMFSQPGLIIRAIHHVVSKVRSERWAPAALGPEVGRRPGGAGLAYGPSFPVR